MNQQEKWVELFKEVVGRIPSPDEFVAGKESGFDFKQIKSIAGLIQEVEQNQIEEPVFEAPEVITAPQVADTIIPTATESTPIPVKASISPLKRKRAILAGVGIVAVVGLGAGYFYMEQQTGADVTAKQFLESIQKEDYSGIAQQLSTKKDKWKQADAKAFVTYLEEQTNIATEVEKMEKDPSYVYSDDAGNKLLGLEKTDSILGIFPTYKVTSYPIEVFVKTNTDGLSVENKKLDKDKELSLGSFSFIDQRFKLSGKTELGDIDTEIVVAAKQAEGNKVHLALNATDKVVKAVLPKDLPTVENKKLFINDKEVAAALEKDVKLLENQNIAVQAEFTYEGTTYRTEKKNIVVSPNQKELVAETVLSDDQMKKLGDATKARADKDAAAKKEQENEEKIKVFMADYIKAMRSSIRNRQNGFSQYFDTTSASYQVMDNYVRTEVASLRIDYQETLEYTVTNITKEGDNYAVTVHNRFRQYFMDGKSNLLDKIQVFKLRPDGSSFLIYDISDF